MYFYQFYVFSPTYNTHAFDAAGGNVVMYSILDSELSGNQSQGYELRVFPW